MKSSLTAFNERVAIWAVMEILAESRTEAAELQEVLEDVRRLLEIKDIT